MQAARPIVSRILGQSARRYGGDAGHGHFKTPSMDELPVPNGSWQQHNERLQRKYNATLAAGIGFAVFSIIVAKQSGLVYFNWSPPASID